MQIFYSKIISVGGDERHFRVEIIMEPGNLGVRARVTRWDELTLGGLPQKRGAARRLCARRWRASPAGDSTGSEGSALQTKSENQ